MLWQSDWLLRADFQVGNLGPVLHTMGLVTQTLLLLLSGLIHERVNA